MLRRNIFSVSKKGRNSKEDTSRTQLLSQLQEVVSQLSRAYTNFNSSADPDLIESCVYEINSLQARYGYLLRSAKDKGLENIEIFKFPKSSQSQQQKGV